MTFCVDIDGTICTNTEGDYDRAEPFPKIIERVNRIFGEGHRIVLFTARGFATGIDWRPTTERQLKEWGVRYHDLRFGKPNADVYIDDRGLNVHDWLSRPAAELAKIKK